MRGYVRVPSTAALGPFARYALWVQGYPFRRAGCIAPGSQPEQGGERLSPQALADELLSAPGIEGVTLTGGEPFAQAAGLVAVLRRVRPRDLGVIVYSGFRLAQLEKRARHEAGIADLLAATDLLIDGRYVRALNEDSGLRGSANQQAHALSDRYRAFRPRRVFGQTDGNLSPDRDAPYHRGVC